jgi:hypothetical protein
MIKKLIYGQSKASKNNLRKKLRQIQRILSRITLRELLLPPSICSRDLITLMEMMFLPPRELSSKFGHMKGLVHFSLLNGVLIP